MRIVVAGDRFWNCDRLAESVLRRSLAQYGPDNVIGLSGVLGADHAFSTACRGPGIPEGLHLAEFNHLGDDRLSDCQSIRAGPDFASSFTTLRMMMAARTWRGKLSGRG